MVNDGIQIQDGDQNMAGRWRTIACLAALTEAQGGELLRSTCAKPIGSAPKIIADVDQLFDATITIFQPSIPPTFQASLCYVHDARCPKNSH